MMKTLFCKSLLLAVMLLSLVQIAIAQPEGDMATPADPKATMGMAIDALNKGEREVFMSYWAEEDNIVFINPVMNELLIGRAAIDKAIKALRLPDDVVLVLSNFNVKYTQQGKVAWMTVDVNRQYVGGAKPDALTHRRSVIRMIKTAAGWRITAIVTTYT